MSCTAGVTCPHVVCWALRGYSAVRYHASGLCVPGAFCTASDDEPMGCMLRGNKESRPDLAWRIGASSQPVCRSRQLRSVPEYQVACRYAIHLDRCAPGAAGYFRHRYSLIAQPGTSKLGDTCRCWPAPSELSEPAACRPHRAPLPLSAACTCPVAWYLRSETRCTCDARTCPPARPFASTASTALRKNISTYRLAVSPFPFSSPPSHTFSQPVFPRNAPTSVFSQLFLGHQATLTQLPPSLHQSSSSTLSFRHTSYAYQASPLHPPTRHHVCYQRGERLRSPR